ncbi:MAG: class I SAM-dependent methyltransferase [Patescibacteria group bacterium]
MTESMTETVHGTDAEDMGEGQLSPSSEYISLLHQRYREELDTTELMRLSPEELRGLADSDLAVHAENIGMLESGELSASLLAVVMDRIEGSNMEGAADLRMLEIALLEILQKLSMSQEGLVLLTETQRQQVFELAFDSDPQRSRIGISVLPHVLSLDARAHLVADQEGNMPEESLVTQLQNRIRMQLLEERQEDMPTGSNLVVEGGLDYLWNYDPQKFAAFSLELMLESPNEGSAKEIFGYVASRLTVEYALKLLHQYRDAVPDQAARVHQLDDWLGIKTPGTEQRSMADNYGEFRIGEYEANDAELKMEMELIRQTLTELAGDESMRERLSGRIIFDAACGTGRHLKELHQMDIGVRLVGMDLVPAHIDQTRRTVPEVELMVGSWDSVPLADNSVTLYLNLGRSVLHNQTVEEYVACFTEAARVLTDDGIILTDSADPTHGHYQKEPERVHRHLEDTLSISRKTAQPGTLFDHPTDATSFKRLNLTEEQFHAVAALAGLEAQKVQKQVYDEEQYPHTTFYWELRKRTQRLTSEEAIAAISKAYLAKPILRIE